MDDCTKSPIVGLRLIADISQNSGYKPVECFKVFFWKGTPADYRREISNVAKQTQVPNFPRQLSSDIRS
jgi:hypothetical protein